MRLVLTSEQTKKLASSFGTVEVVDSNGLTLGKFTIDDPKASETKTLSVEELAELRRQVKDTAVKGSNFTAHQVID